MKEVSLIKNVSLFAYTLFTPSHNRTLSDAQVFVRLTGRAPALVFLIPMAVPQSCNLESERRSRPRPGFHRVVISYRPLHQPLHSRAKILERMHTSLDLSCSFSRLYARLT